MKTSSYYLNGPFLRQVLDRACLAHDDFAEEIGVSRSHFSVVLNGHLPLSKRMRRKLLESPRLKGIPEAMLWYEVTPEGPCAA